MKTLSALLSALMLFSTASFSQELTLLPPPPPMRNPMLVPEKALPVPPSLGQSSTIEMETPGWIMRRGNSGKWQVLWEGRWVGKNQMMGSERIINIDEYGIQVKGIGGKRNIPMVGVNIGHQQKENKQ